MTSPFDLDAALALARKEAAWNAGLRRPSGGVARLAAALEAACAEVERLRALADKMEISLHATAMKRDAADAALAALKGTP